MTLSREQIFELWAPEASPWSVWAKPVLFSHLYPPGPNRAWFASLPPSPNIAPWMPAVNGSTLLVIDLPGANSVQLGEAAALVGFRPVPLFNALPGPFQATTSALGLPQSALVEIHSIVDAIQQVSARSSDAFSSLRIEAPPAFLLDANRGVGRVPRPGDFDNRSISLPTDFPSANFLHARGVSRVLLMTASSEGLSTSLQPARDLAHTLLRWQKAGLEIRACTIDDAFVASDIQSIEVARPSWFGAIWHNALSMLGLRRNPLGGFGGTLPVPSAG